MLKFSIAPNIVLTQNREHKQRMQYTEKAPIRLHFESSILFSLVNIAEREHTFSQPLRQQLYLQRTGHELVKTKNANGVKIRQVFE